MAELHYAFIKDGRVKNIAVFASKDEKLADRIATEQGYDDVVWVGENKPHLYSSYDGKTFTPPTNEELFELGILSVSPTQDDFVSSIEDELIE